MDTGTAADRPVDAIVIGASAGGVEALLSLLPGLPADLRAAVLVVLHLPRARPSLLPGLFAPRCALPVREACDKEPAQRGAIYFAPPDYHLLVDKGPRLSLSADALVNHSRPSIDVLFESAADVYGKRLMGIILTGASSDGAAGLQAVHEAGGVCIVQSPDTAYSPSMPAAAMRRRFHPDHVLPLAGIAEHLKRLGRGGGEFSKGP
jgi:two-component system chemotaxis response regulator CheB